MADQFGTKSGRTPSANPKQSQVPKQMSGKVVAKSGTKEVVIKHGKDG